MKYMLLIYGDENGLSETERKDCYVESTQLAHQLHSNGQYVAANPFIPQPWRPAFGCGRESGL